MVTLRLCRETGSTAVKRRVEIFRVPEVVFHELMHFVDFNVDGELPAIYLLDAYPDASLALPVCKVGESDFFFAVNNSRPDILAELNAAMSRIQDENHYYNQQLYAKHIRTAGVDLYLTEDEKAWLSSHGTIRVGYQDNYLAFCAKDPATGELTGLYNKNCFNEYANRSELVQGYYFSRPLPAAEFEKSLIDK